MILCWVYPFLSLLKSDDQNAATMDSGFQFLSCTIFNSIVLRKEHFNRETYLNGGNSWHQRRWMVEKFLLLNACIISMWPDPGAANEMEATLHMFSLAQLLRATEATKYLVLSSWQEWERTRVLFRGAQPRGWEVEHWKVKNGPKFLSLAVSLECYKNMSNADNRKYWTCRPFPTFLVSKPYFPVRVAGS